MPLRAWRLSALPPRLAGKPERIVRQIVWKDAEPIQPTGHILARNDFLSTVRIQRRPFYQGFAAFAAACFVGTLATDIAYLSTASIMWADFSDWLLAAGVIVGCATVIVALIETFVIPAPLRSRLSGRFVIGSVVALILAIFDMHLGGDLGVRHAS